MQPAALGGRWHTQQPQREQANFVQDGDGKREYPLYENHRGGEQQDGALRVLQRQRLRHHLTDDDVQVSNNRQSDQKRNRVNNITFQPEPVMQRRFNQMRDCWLADHA